MAKFNDYEQTKNIGAEGMRAVTMLDAQKAGFSLEEAREYGKLTAAAFRYGFQKGYEYARHGNNNQTSKKSH